jgi:hypothetical protein
MVVVGWGCFSVLAFVFFLAEETEGVFKQQSRAYAGYVISN